MMHLITRRDTLRMGMATALALSRAVPIRRSAVCNGPNMIRLNARR